MEKMSKQQIILMSIRTLETGDLTAHHIQEVGIMASALVRLAPSINRLIVSSKESLGEESPPFQYARELQSLLGKRMGVEEDPAFDVPGWHAKNGSQILALKDDLERPWVEKEAVLARVARDMRRKKERAVLIMTPWRELPTPTGPTKVPYSRFCACRYIYEGGVFCAVEPVKDPYPASSKFVLNPKVTELH